jgi:uncharacterized protein (TIGR03083 family)
MRTVFDYDKIEVRDAVLDQRRRTVELLRTFSDADWEREVVPRWRLREVAAHMVATDQASLTGRILILGLRQAPIAKIEAWNDEAVKRWADRPTPEIIEGLTKWGRRIARLAGAMPSRMARAGIPGPFGKVSLLWLGMMRVYDEWIHLEDVRRTFELPSDDAAANVAPVARHLLAGIPVQTFPNIPEGATGRVGLAYEDVDLPVVGFDLATKGITIAPTSSDARITARAPALVMVAARRDPWRDAEERGGLKVEGDRATAERFLDALLLV